MPATGRSRGTPASIIDSDEPQTVAIDDDPLDLGDLGDHAHGVGERLLRGMSGLRARQASLPWPISRRPGARRKLASPTE